MATVMAKYSSGPATGHILASQGPSTNPLNFYSTTYSVQHGRHRTFPRSNQPRHKGTGYIANFRPTIYYNRAVDFTDSPMIATILNDVYDTSFSRDYKPQKLNTGYEPLPTCSRQGPSGYTHNLPITRALYSHRACSNTQYRQEYPSKKFRDGNLKQSNHTNQEKSGYSHSYNIEPITYRPTECHSGELPGEVTWRPTGMSLMKTDFTQSCPLTGHETLPMASVRANSSNGYIKGNCCPAKAQPVDIREPTAEQLHCQVAYTKRKSDPAHFSTITHPQRYTAYSNITYTPHQIHPYNTQRSDIGRKEASGYRDNTTPHFTPTALLSENTSSGDNFSAPAIPQLPSTDMTVRPVLPNGFTKSTRVHTHGSHLNPADTLRKQNPYVAKSILAKDPCFVDLTYRNKKK